MSSFSFLKIPTQQDERQGKKRKKAKVFSLHEWGWVLSRPSRHYINIYEYICVRTAVTILFDTDMYTRRERDGEKVYTVRMYAEG